MTAPRFPPGTILAGRYTIQAQLAYRPWVATYSAIAAPNRELVVKVIDPALATRPEACGVLRQMSAAASALGERCVFPLIDSGRDAGNGCDYLVTALSHHPSLAQLVELCPLEAMEVATLVQNIARALDTAHAAGVLHLSLKPSNVFVGPAPDYAVRLSDFGATGFRCAAEREERWAIDGPWMAPEQRETEGGSPLSPATDLFALAQITSFALTGRASGAELPGSVEAVLARALAVAPADRFPSAMAFAEAFAKSVGVAWLERAAPARVESLPEQVVSAPALTISIAPSPSAPAAPIAAPVHIDPPPPPHAPLPAAPRADAPAPPRRARRFAAAGAVLAAAAIAAAAMAVAKIAHPPPTRTASTATALAPAVTPPPPIDTPQPTAPVAPSATAAEPPPAGTRLLVVCTPECDRVLINGKRMVGYPDEVTLPPGTYGIGVARHGYGGQYQMVKLRKGQQETVQFTLTRVR